MGAARMVAGPTPAGAGRIIVHTARLPGMKLTSTLLPLVVAPQRTPMAMIAPESCWPQRMRDDPSLLDRVAPSHARPDACFALPDPLEERQRTVRPRGAPPRVTVSPAFREALRTACGGAVHGTIVVRVDAQGDFALSFASQCPDELRSFKVGDLVIGYHEAEVDGLDGLRLDWSSGAFGPGYSAWRDVV